MNRREAYEIKNDVRGARKMFERDIKVLTDSELCDLEEDMKKNGLWEDLGHMVEEERKGR